MSLYIDATLPEEHLGKFYQELAKLPSNLSYIQMNDGENDPKFSVAFQDLATSTNVPVNTDGGYFLYARDVCYGVRFFENKVRFFIECSFDENVFVLMKILANFPVIYAYASQIEERKHQNRIVVKKPYGIHETWVGRDFNRYLPGMYWLNLIPKSLLAKHGVTEKEINSIAISCKKLDSENYLIQLYSASKDWVDQLAKIDKWREDTPGVFYKQAAEVALKKSTNFLDDCDATNEWK